ncbi:MAG: TIGR01777 family oxidoreductase [Crocinitomicaceae bacterium]|nr:TIGR01777 family oxidoreductase [Crocinitomicaceae bacterium]
MENKIIIAGGSGFLGSEMIKFFQLKDYEIVVLTRGKSLKIANIQHVHWDGETLGTWIEELEGAKAVINLSGKNVNCRFTEANKKEILDSRVHSTTLIGKAIEKCQLPPEVWINASGISVYADSYEKQMTEEDFELGTTFMSQVAQEWEKAIYQFDQLPIRKLAIRIGIVLGNEGALKILKKQTRFGLGGKHGNGKQMMPWIHIQDLIGIFDFAIQHDNLNQPLNGCSPHPASDQQFMKTLRQVMKMPIGIPAPVFAIKIGAKILGTEADLILSSTNAFPKRVLDAGYIFKFPDLKSALEDLK